MKKKYRWAVVAAIFLSAACAKEELPDGTGEQISREIIEVGIDDQSTKVAFGNVMKGEILWKEGDKIAVYGNDSNTYSTYILSSGAGTQNARFKYVKGSADLKKITKVVYPLSAADGTIPAQQTYTAGTFDPEALVLMYEGTGKDEPIVLQNRSSVIGIPLKGNAVVSSIEVQYKTTKGNVTTNSKIYKLSSPEGVVNLKDGSATDFYLAVPPMENNPEAVYFTLMVNCDNGAVQTRTSSKLKLQPNEMHLLPEWTLSKKAGWHISYCSTSSSYENYRGAPNGHARYAIDDNPKSWWNHGAKDEQFVFFVDFGTETKVKKLRFRARQPMFGTARAPYEVEVAFSGSHRSKPGDLFGSYETIKNEDKSNDWTVALSKGSTAAVTMKVTVKSIFNDKNQSLWSQGVCLAELDVEE